MVPLHQVEGVAISGVISVSGLWSVFAMIQTENLTLTGMDRVRYMGVAQLAPYRLTGAPPEKSWPKPPKSASRSLSLPALVGRTGPFFAPKEESVPPNETQPTSPLDLQHNEFQHFQPYLGELL